MPFYKMLLNKPINLADIEAVDPHLFNSLRWMLANDITDIIDTTFSVEHDSFGCLKVTKSDGSSVMDPKLLNTGDPQIDYPDPV